MVRCDEVITEVPLVDKRQDCSIVSELVSRTWYKVMTFGGRVKQILNVHVKLHSVNLQFSSTFKDTETYLLLLCI